MAITLAIAEAKLDLWLAAEDAVATGQSYTVNNRSLTRANLSEIRGQIDYWEGKINKLSRGGGIRITGASPL